MQTLGGFGCNWWNGIDCTRCNFCGHLNPESMLHYTIMVKRWIPVNEEVLLYPCDAVTMDVVIVMVPQAMHICPECDGIRRYFTEWVRGVLFLSTGNNKKGQMYVMMMMNDGRVNLKRVLHWCQSRQTRWRLSTDASGSSLSSHGIIQWWLHHADHWLHHAGHPELKVECVGHIILSRRKFKYLISCDNDQQICCILMWSHPSVLHMLSNFNGLMSAFLLTMNTLMWWTSSSSVSYVQLWWHPTVLCTVVPACISNCFSLYFYLGTEVSTSAELWPDTDDGF